MTVKLERELCGMGAPTAEAVVSDVSTYPLARHSADAGHSGLLERQGRAELRVADRHHCERAQAGRFRNWRAIQEVVRALGRMALAGSEGVALPSIPGSTTDGFVSVAAASSQGTGRTDLQALSKASRVINQRLKIVPMLWLR